MEEVLDKLDIAYQAWHDCRGLDPMVWADLIDERINWRSVGSEHGGLNWARTRTSKADALDHLASISREWDMVYYKPKTIIREGNRVAMFGATKWTFKATGKGAEAMICHFWRFRNGKAIELVEIFDTARAVAATRAGEGGLISP